MLPRYRVMTALVFLFSSFVFGQDITEQSFIKMSYLDKASLSVYCGLSIIFDPNERLKCSSENMTPPNPKPILKSPVNINTPIEFQPEVLATATPVLPPVSANPVLDELRSKIEENTKDIDNLEKRADALESGMKGQTIIKYVSGGKGMQGPRGEPGLNGTTTIVHSTSSYIYYSSSTDNILVNKDVLSSGKVISSSFCVEEVCIDKNTFKKVVDYFK